MATRSVDGGVVRNPTIPQSASLTAPFTQGGRRPTTLSALTKRLSYLPRSPCGGAHGPRPTGLCRPLCCLFLLRFQRHRHADGRPLPRRAVQMQAAAQIADGVLDDGQAQAGAAALAWNGSCPPGRTAQTPAPDAPGGCRCRCRPQSATALSPQRPTSTVTLPPGTLYLMALSQRLYRISDSSRRAAAHRHILAGNGHGHVLRLRPRREGQRTASSASGSSVHRLRRQRYSLVQLGQADDILNQRHQPGGLVSGCGSAKHRHILRLNQSVLHQLGAAHDGLQRGFQLVGHVGGELPPVALVPAPAPLRRRPAPPRR